MDVLTERLCLDCQGTGFWIEDGDCTTCGGNGVVPRKGVTCGCEWPHGHCESCARVWGLTAVHMTPDGTCAMYGHREGDLS